MVSRQVSHCSYIFSPAMVAIGVALFPHAPHSVMSMYVLYRKPDPTSIARLDVHIAERYRFPSMSKRMISIAEYTCERCGHVWIAKQRKAPPPKTCAKCKSPYWDRPKRKK